MPTNRDSNFSENFDSDITFCSFCSPICMVVMSKWYVKDSKNSQKNIFFTDQPSTSNALIPLATPNKTKKVREKKFSKILSSFHNNFLLPAIPQTSTVEITKNIRQTKERREIKVPDLHHRKSTPYVLRQKIRHRQTSASSVISVTSQDRWISNSYIDGDVWDERLPRIRPRTQAIRHSFTGIVQRYPDSCDLNAEKSTRVDILQIPDGKQGEEIKKIRPKTRTIKKADNIQLFYIPFDCCEVDNGQDEKSVVEYHGEAKDLEQPHVDILEIPDEESTKNRPKAENIQLVYVPFDCWDRNNGKVVECQEKNRVERRKWKKPRVNVATMVRRAEKHAEISDDCCGDMEYGGEGCCCCCWKRMMWSRRCSSPAGFKFEGRRKRGRRRRRHMRCPVALTAIVSRVGQQRRVARRFVTSAVTLSYCFLCKLPHKRSGTRCIYSSSCCNISRPTTNSVDELLTIVQEAWATPSATTEMNHRDKNGTDVAENNNGTSCSSPSWSPILIRRRLSVPEIIMRKHALSRQRSRSDSISDTESISALLPLDKQRTSSPSPSHSPTSFATLRYRNLIFERTSGSDGDLPHLRDGRGHHLPNNPHIHHHPHQHYQRKRDSVMHMRKSALLRRFWNKQELQRNSSIDVLYTSPNTTNLSPPRRWSPTRSRLASLNNIDQELNDNVLRLETNNNTIRSSSSPIWTPSISTQTHETVWVENNSICSTFTSEYPPSAQTNFTKTPRSSDSVYSNEIQITESKNLTVQLTNKLVDSSPKKQFTQIIHGEKSPSNMASNSRCCPNRKSDENPNTPYGSSMDVNVSEVGVSDEITEDMMSHIISGSIYQTAEADSETLVPRFSAVPRTTSMEVGVSSGECVTEDSDACSLVDSLEDGTSPRPRLDTPPTNSPINKKLVQHVYIKTNQENANKLQVHSSNINSNAATISTTEPSSILTSSNSQCACSKNVKYDNKPVRGEIKIPTPPDSDIPSPTRNKRSSAYYIDIKHIENHSEPPVPPPPITMPKKLIENIHKRQEILEHHKNIRRKSECNFNDANGNLRPEKSFVVRHECNKRTLRKSSQKTDDKLMKSLDHLERFRIDSHGNRQMITKENNWTRRAEVVQNKTQITNRPLVGNVQRIRRSKTHNVGAKIQNKSVQSLTIADEGNSIKYTNTTKNSQPNDSINSENKPRRIYQKTEFNDGERHIEILEIVECVNDNLNDKNRGGPRFGEITTSFKSKIPVPTYQRKDIDNSEINANYHEKSITVDQKPINIAQAIVSPDFNSNPSIDRLVAGILIGNLNSPSDLDHLKTRDTLIYANNNKSLVPKIPLIQIRNEIHQALKQHVAQHKPQKFEAIPEEKCTFSDLPTDENHTDTICAKCPAKISQSSQTFKPNEPNQSDSYKTHVTVVMRQTSESQTAKSNQIEPKKKEVQVSTEDKVEVKTVATNTSQDERKVVKKPEKVIAKHSCIGKDLLPPATKAKNPKVNSRTVPVSLTRDFGVQTNLTSSKFELESLPVTCHEKYINQATQTGDEAGHAGESPRKMCCQAHYKGREALESPTEEINPKLPKGWESFYLLQSVQSPPPPPLPVSTSVVTQTEENQTGQIDTKRAPFIQMNSNSSSNSCKSQHGKAECHKSSSSMIAVENLPTVITNKTSIEETVRLRLMPDEKSIVTTKSSETNIRNENNQTSRSDYFSSSGSSSDSDDDDSNDDEFMASKFIYPPLIPTGRHVRKHRSRIETRDRYTAYNNSSEGWSVTVSGRNDNGQMLAPDVKMRLRFPHPPQSSNDNIVVGQSDPIGNERQPRLQPPPTAVPIPHALSQISRPDQERHHLHHPHSRSGRYPISVSKHAALGIVKHPSSHLSNSKMKLQYLPEVNKLKNSSKPSAKRWDFVRNTLENGRSRGQTASQMSCRRSGLQRIKTSTGKWLYEEDIRVISPPAGSLSVIGSMIKPEKKPKVPTMSERDLTRLHSPYMYSTLSSEK